MKMAHYEIHPYSGITIPQYCSMLLKAYETTLTPALIAKAFEDNGQVPPFNVREKLEPNLLGRNSADTAAQGQVASRPLRRRQSVADKFPEKLDAAFVMNPENPMPSDPLASW